MRIVSMLETLDHTIRIGSTPTFSYFDLYFHSAYAAHYVYYIYYSWMVGHGVVLFVQEFVMHTSHKPVTVVVQY